MRKLHFRTLAFLRSKFSIVILILFSPVLTHANTLLFQTRIGDRVDAPVTVPDGRGAGVVPGMMAQLFIVDQGVLTALEPMTGFITSHPDIPETYRYVDPLLIVVPPNPCSLTIIRFRVWESTQGATFEDARDRGGYFGEAETQIQLSDSAELRGLPGFTLERRTTPGGTATDTVHRSTVAPTVTGGGQVVFANKVGTALDAPITLPDGRGAGEVSGIVAQLFLAQGTQLVPVLPQTAFHGPTPVSIAARYIFNQTVELPIPPGCFATLRFRVWESAKGETLESARANGGYFGEAEVTVVLGGGTTPPSNLLGLQGFSLRRLNTLTLDAAAQGGLDLHLETADSTTYSLESSTDLITWKPLGLQGTGTNRVVAPVQSRQQFFRAVFQ